MESNKNQLVHQDSTMPLISVLQTGYDAVKVNKHLELYKERGVVSFPKVLALPMSERIPELIRKEGGKEQVVFALTAAIGAAVSRIHLKYPMSNDDVVELACMIVDQSHEDYYGIEDVILFLQGLLVGNYGKIYDRLDIFKFFECFETYRQERHNEYRRIRDEQESQYKMLGQDRSGQRMSKDIDAPAFFDLLDTVHGSHED